MKRLLKQSALGAALALAGMLGANGIAVADSVYAEYNGLTPSNLVVNYDIDMNVPGGGSLDKDGATFAGMFNFDNATGPIYMNSGEFVSFCIELEDTVIASNTYDIKGLTNSPDPASGPMGARAQDLAELLGGAIASGRLNDATALSDNQKAALQIAIWEVVHEESGSYDVTTGTAKFFDAGSNTTVADLSGLISGYLANIGSATAMEGLVGLIGRNNGQDFIGQVPLPAAAWLFISAVVGVAALGRRTKKGEATVAA